MMKVDKEVALNFIFQGMNVVLPIVTLRYMIGNLSAGQVLEYESLLSLIGFFAFLVDFSTSTLLARQVHFFYGGARVASVVLLKLALCFISLFLITFIAAIFGSGIKLVLASFLVLVGGAFDFSYIYLADGTYYRYMFLQTMRGLCILILILISVDPVWSYVVTSFGLVVGAYYLLLDKKPVLRWHVQRRLIGFLFKKFTLPTATEVLTAVFSQLDSYLVASLASSEVGIQYVTIRKVIRGVLSLINNLFKIVYIRATRNEAHSVNRFIFGYIFVATLFLAIVGLPLMKILAGTHYKPMLYYGFLIQLTILPFGYWKNHITYNDLLVKERFTRYLGYTFISSGGYILMLTNPFATLTIIFLSTIRTLADVVFIAFYYLGKFYDRRTMRYSLREAAKVN